MTRCPPLSRGIHRSKVEASNAMEAWPSTVCRAPSGAPSPQQWSAARPTTSPWVTAMPLGVPVEPEVYMTYATVSAWAVGAARSVAGRSATVPAQSSTCTAGTPGR
ncbi:hypothetical protein SRIMM317S_03953 [Streptomyces rimosus subsp. rimosus]